MSAHSFTATRPDPRSPARLGRLVTPHGSVDTPAFLVSGSQGAVSSLQPQELAALGAQALAISAYHLALRPGPDLIAEMGGLHAFMNWPGPLFTDGGSYHVFRLGFGPEHATRKTITMFPDPADVGGRRDARAPANQGRLGKADEDGVTFRSHLDGSTHVLTPERAIEIQAMLGADVMVALDQPTSPVHDEAHTARALARTHRWAERSLAMQRRQDQALYGVVQGGTYQGLRTESAAYIGGLPFDGYVIGGSLGTTRRHLDQVLSWTLPALPEARPRHLPGIWQPTDLFRAVEAGIDTFDCVAPTRFGRQGVILTADGPVRITRARYREDDGPIDPDCGCPTCTTFTRAYLRHLFSAEELLAYTLATTHNLAFILGLMSRIRAALADGCLPALKSEVLARYAGRGDPTLAVGAPTA